MIPNVIMMTSWCCHRGDPGVSNLQNWGPPWALNFLREPWGADWNSSLSSMHLRDKLNFWVSFTVIHWYHMPKYTAVNPTSGPWNYMKLSWMLLNAYFLQSVPAVRAFRAVRVVPVEDFEFGQCRGTASSLRSAMNELDAAVEGLEARKVVAPWHITFSYVFNIQLKAPAEDQTKAIQEGVQQKQNIQTTWRKKNIKEHGKNSGLFTSMWQPMKAPNGRHQETDRSQVANPRGSSGVCGETAVVALLLTSRSEMSRSDKCSGLEASSHVRIG